MITCILKLFVVSEWASHEITRNYLGKDYALTLYDMPGDPAVSKNVVNASISNPRANEQNSFRFDTYINLYVHSSRILRLEVGPICLTF